MNRSLLRQSLTLAAAAFVAACGSDFNLPTADPLDGPDGELAVPWAATASVVADQVCEQVTFESGFADGVHIPTIPIATLAGGFDLSVTVVGDGDSNNIAIGWDSNMDHGLTTNNRDLENGAVVSEGECSDCEGTMMIIPFYKYPPEVGDSPDGGTITLTGFPTEGETIIRSFMAVDQEDDETITLYVDGVQTGQATPAGNGSVQTVVADATPAIGTDVVFDLSGSGAIDGIVICHTPDPPDPTNPGTGTIGYWKNHPDAWPVEMIEIGGETYTKAEAIAWMKAPIKGDKTINMFKQLVAAKLNVLIGNDDSCIADTIAYADAWLADNPVGSKVRANKPAWKNGGGGAHSMLTDYNEGKLCAPHRG